MSNISIYLNFFQNVVDKRRKFLYKETAWEVFVFGEYFDVLQIFIQKQFFYQTL